MTYEEASDVIECLLIDIVLSFAGKDMPKSAKCTFEALEKAKEALEKADKLEKLIARGKSQIDRIGDVAE